MFSASTLDQMPKQLSSGLMFGHWLSVPVPDIERSDCLLVLGANPVVSNGSLWTVPDFRGKAKALRARGGKLVVIDPRRTETAALADEHHFIRPGADVFLLRGMVHTLFDEGLVRLGPARAARGGRRRRCAQAVQPFAPERVAARCGIDGRRRSARLARELAAAPSGLRLRPHRHLHAGVRHAASWLVDVLNALTGHLDEPGGAMFPKAAAFARQHRAARRARPRHRHRAATRSRVSGAPEVFGELPMACLAEEIETPGRGPDQGADHGRRQSGAVGARTGRAWPRRWTRSTSWSASTSTSTRPRATPT